MEVIMRYYGPDSFNNILKVGALTLLVSFSFYSICFCQGEDVDRLIRNLKSENFSVRASAAHALGEIKDPHAVEPLIAALKGMDPRVQQAAANALGEIKDPRAVEPLIAALRDTDWNMYRGVSWNIRDAAADALGKINDPRAVEPRIAALNDTDQNVDWGVRWNIRRAAARALANFKDPRAVSALLAALEKHDMIIIASAISFFIKRGDTGSEDRLIEALDKFGNKEMAEQLLNCGNSKLNDAARKWGLNHGYAIDTRADVSGMIKWGEGKRYP
jgi:HEAT repeat protein